jgi:hypothetical protein
MARRAIPLVGALVMFFSAGVAHAQDEPDMGDGVAVLTGERDDQADVAADVVEDLTVEAPVVQPQPVLTGIWRRLAMCESSLVPTAVSANRLYFGLFQFDLQTWRSVGEVGNPTAASPARQLAAAQRLQARRGWAPWPTCRRILGLP